MTSEQTRREFIGASAAALTIASATPQQSLARTSESEAQPDDSLEKDSRFRAEVECIDEDGRRHVIPAEGPFIDRMGATLALHNEELMVFRVRAPFNGRAVSYTVYDGDAVFGSAALSGHEQVKRVTVGESLSIALCRPREA